MEHNEESNTEERIVEQDEEEELSKSTEVNEEVNDNTDNVYVCPDPECDYQRPRTKKGFLSVRGHALKAHKLFLALDDNENIIIARGGKPKRSKPVYPPREELVEPIEPREDEEEGFFEPRGSPEEPYVRMPDVLQSLWEHSRKFGLSRKGADTFIEAMKTRNPNDLDEMENVLRDMRADENTINLLIDNWARSRGLHSSRREPRGYDRRARPEEGYGDDRDILTIKKARMYEAFEEEARAKAESYRNPPRYNESNPMVGDLQKRNEELIQKLEAEKELRYQAERLADKAEFDAKLADATKNPNPLVSPAVASRLEKGVDRIGNLGEKLVSGAVASEFPQKPPVREKLFKGKDKGIFEMIPEEMVE